MPTKCIYLAIGVKDVCVYILKYLLSADVHNVTIFIMIHRLIVFVIMMTPIALLINICIIVVSFHHDLRLSAISAERLEI